MPPGDHSQGLLTGLESAILAVAAAFNLKFTQVPVQHNISTAETTTSSGSYADLATVGPTVSCTVGPSGIVILLMSAEMFNSTATAYTDMAIDISGATTIAAAAGNFTRMFAQSTSANIPDNKYSYVTIITGLNPGVTTFKAKYRTITGGTATFQYRQVTVIPWG